MEPMTIVTLAGKCADIFSDRITAVLDDADLDSVIQSQAVETQKARFNLWADDLAPKGVFAEGNASLDARLRDHEDISMLIIGQLELLLRHLKRISMYESGQEDYEAIAAAEYEYVEDGSSSSALSVASFSTISATSSDNHGSKATSLGDAEIREVSPFLAITQALHRLHRVAMAIRESGVSSNKAKAATEQFYDDDNRDVIDVFREWCMKVLHHRFDGADKNILERIASVNADRRRTFLYRKKHRNKLIQRVPITMRGIETMNASSSNVHENARDSVRIKNISGTKSAMSQNTSIMGSAARLSQTTASKVVRAAWRHPASVHSTIISMGPSTQIPGDFSLYPPAPKILAGAAEFYCPYCCRVRDSVERSGRHWRQHFLKDLAPFVCLVADCSTPNRAYQDQLTWIKHMELHNTKYTCRHHAVPLQFACEGDYDEHILDQHRKFPPSRLESLRSINGTSSRLDMETCPLCGFRPHLLASGESTAQNEHAYHELTVHIATHLHEIAMLSLVDENNAGFATNSDVSEIKTLDENSHSEALSFSNIEDETKNNSMDEWQDEYYSHVSRDHEMQQLEESNLDDEWSPFLQVKPPYGGHDHDPKLENFVRRLELEMLLEQDGLPNPQLPCHSVSFKVSRDFYGRDREMQRLKAALDPTRVTKNLRIMALAGPAGIGKTELAARYCQQHQNQYDAVLWVRADEESKLANDFVEIGIQLGFIGRGLPESRDQEHCRQIVKAWLTNPLKVPADPANSDTARWLLVFDHVIDPDTVKDFWPTDCQNGSIIITSRKIMPWSTTYVPMLNIESFDPADSATFLSRLLKVEQSENIRLGSRAFHSPNQLIFLAKMIAHNRYSLRSFVQASQENVGKKAILVLHTEDVTKNKSELSEWALESLSDVAAALLDVMAMLDPDSIMERILMSPPDNIAIMAYPKTVDGYSEARSELSSFSFITRDRAAGSLSIHRFIQDAARKNMSEKYLRDVFNTCISLVSDQWPYQPFTWRHGIRRWDRCEGLYPHIVQLHHLAADMPIPDCDIERSYEFARLATDVAWYCHERGRLTESVGFCETALQVCLALREVLEPNPDRSKLVTIDQVDRTIGEVHHNHGCISAEINEPKKALQHQLVFNGMMLKELENSPGVDMRLGMSFNELGVAYMINDDYINGEECFRRSIAEMRRVENFQPYKISLPLVNLAYCHCLAHRYVEAEEILIEGLAERVREFGENDQESFITGRFYHGLANAKLGQGLEQASFEYLEKARDHYKMTLGRGHHRSADVMVALGRHYNRTQDDKTAVELFSKALDVYGDRSVYAPEKARVFFQRGRSLRNLGLTADAHKDESSCLALYREIRMSDQRPLSELSDHDFDRVVVFWSR